MAMDVNELAGLSDHELMVHAVREVTMMAAKEIDPESRTEKRAIISQLLAVLDRSDVVAARNRLERHYGMIPLPSRRLLTGLWTITAPEEAMRSRSSSSTHTAWITFVRLFNRPSSAVYRTSERPAKRGCSAASTRSSPATSTSPRKR